MHNRVESVSLLACALDASELCRCSRLALRLQYTCRIGKVYIFFLHSRRSLWNGSRMKTVFKTIKILVSRAGKKNERIRYFAPWIQLPINYSLRPLSLWRRWLENSEKKCFKNISKFVESSRVNQLARRAKINIFQLSTAIANAKMFKINSTVALCQNFRVDFVQK